MEKRMTQPYKVTIEGPGLSLVMADVPKAICDQITVLVLTGMAPPVAAVGPQAGNAGQSAHVSAPAAQSHTASHGRLPTLSLREFLNDLEPKRGPDKITAIGMYLNDHDGKETFSSSEAEAAFQSASEPVPGNMPRDMKWTVKTGWIAPAQGAKGRYYVTKTGRTAAEKKFPKELAKKSRLGNNGRKTAKKPVAASVA